MKKRKTLIIKPGYSEFLDSESTSGKVSLGDVLRSTVILHNFKDHNITWLTDKTAGPLLEGNPYIDRLLYINPLNLVLLQEEIFDYVINLEKISGLCALTNKIDAWHKYGFRLDKISGKAEAFNDAFEVLAVSSDKTKKRTNQRLYQELIFELVGKEWINEEYVLGFDPSSSLKYDVCLNTEVGSKWPNKKWPTEKWSELESLLKNKGLKVSRQDQQDKEILTSLCAYMNWINSGKTIISNDSLGMHLGIAMKKNVIGLFGPTPSREVCFYNRGQAITPEHNYNCMPCFESRCDKYDHSCIDLISPKQVLETYLRIKDE